MTVKDKQNSTRNR